MKVTSCASFITPAVALSMALASATGTAQEVAGRRVGTGITSPEVAEDRRVTFRLRTPEAKAVTVSGDFGNDAEMRRSADGVWIATVGRLDPEMYVYHFTVDGVRLTDPSGSNQELQREDRWGG